MPDREPFPFPFLSFDTHRLTEREAELIRELPELILSSDVDLSQWTVEQLFNAAVNTKCALWTGLFKPDASRPMHQWRLRKPDEFGNL